VAISSLSATGGGRKSGIRLGIRRRRMEEDMDGLKA